MRRENRTFHKPTISTHKYSSHESPFPSQQQEDPAQIFPMFTGPWVEEVRLKPKIISKN